MRKLYEILEVLKVQKIIVSVETIHGSTVVKQCCIKIFLKKNKLIFDFENQTLVILIKSQAS